MLSKMDLHIFLVLQLSLPSIFALMQDEILQKQMVLGEVQVMSSSSSVLSLS